MARIIHYLCKLVHFAYVCCCLPGMMMSFVEDVAPAMLGLYAVLTLYALAIITGRSMREFFQNQVIPKRKMLPTW